MNPGIYDKCLIFRCKKNSKEFYTVGNGKVEAEPDEAVNRAMKNGTGGILVVDVDGKNGGTITGLKQLFPELQQTMTVATVSPNSYHLIYSIPRGFRVRTGLQLVQGVEIPAWAMLFGSVVKDRHGRERTYTIIDDHPVVEAPAELLAIVEASDDEYFDAGRPISRGEIASEVDEAAVDHLLQRFRDAPSGRRNEVYLQIALPVLQELGADLGEIALFEAYPGDNDVWIESAIKSSIEKLAGGEGGGNSRPPRMTRVVHASSRRDSLLEGIYENALLGRWEDGKTSTLDRRIFTYILERARVLNEHKITISIGTTAIYTGTYPHRVRESLLRLIKGKKLMQPFPEDPLQYSPVCCIQVRIINKGDNPLGLSPLNSRDIVGLLSPSNPVWLSEGLDGRHSHVLAALACGSKSKSAIAEQIGVHRSTVSRVLRVLEQAGLVVDGSLAAEAPQIAITLANERGGFARQAGVKKAVEDSLRRKNELEADRYRETLESIRAAQLPRELDDEVLWSQIM